MVGGESACFEGKIVVGQRAYDHVRERLTLSRQPAELKADQSMIYISANGDVLLVSETGNSEKAKAQGDFNRNAIRKLRNSTLALMIEGARPPQYIMPSRTQLGSEERDSHPLIAGVEWHHLTYLDQPDAQSSLQV